MTDSSVCKLGFYKPVLMHFVALSGFFESASKPTTHGYRSDQLDKFDVSDKRVPLVLLGEEVVPASFSEVGRILPGLDRPHDQGNTR